MGPLPTKNFNSSGSKTLRHHQVKSQARQALGIFNGDHGVLTFPYHWSLLTILDVEPLPRLIAEPLVAKQFVNPPGWRAAAGQARYLTTTPLAMAAVATVHHPWWVEPGSEAPRDFADILLAAAGQLPQELWLRAVTCIEGYPFEHETIVHRSLVQVQADLPLGPVDHGIGDTCLTATVAIGVPALRQIQLTVEKAVKIAASEAQVDGDDAVLGLAQTATPLFLNPGSFVPFLDVAGLVDHPNRMGAGVFGSHVALEPIAHPVFVPLELAEELLQRPRCNTRFQSYWLDALLRQVRELPAHVDPKMGSRIFPTEAIAETIEERTKLYFQLTKLVGVHAMPSLSPWEGWILAFGASRGNVELAL